MFDAAKQVGIFVTLRPGPYVSVSAASSCSLYKNLSKINAETTAGGLAVWVTSTTSGELRSGAVDWRASWQQYVHSIINQTVPNQVSNGGPVILVQIGVYRIFASTYEKF